jgi:hypothetical protein
MRLYRIVASDPPTEEDFLSHEAKGKPLPHGADAALIRAWRGVSTFTTLEYAAATARATKGRFGYLVAELEVPDSAEADFGADRPLGRHVDLFGVTPQQLMAWVIRIHSP